MCDHKQSFTNTAARSRTGLRSSSLESTQTVATSSRQTHPGLPILPRQGHRQGRSEVIEYFEEEDPDSLNAAVKMGLTALKGTLDDDLNKDAVEIAYVDEGGYTSSTGKRQSRASRRSDLRQTYAKPVMGGHGQPRRRRRRDWKVWTEVWI